jgi:hypothetical protein
MEVLPGSTISFRHAGSSSHIRLVLSPLCGAVKTSLIAPSTILASRRAINKPLPFRCCYISFAQKHIATLKDQGNLNYKMASPIVPSISPDAAPIAGLPALLSHMDDLIAEPAHPLNPKLFDDVELQLAGEFRREVLLAILFSN